MPFGSCLCGHVAFQVDGKPKLMYHCHCSVCRCASGASFTTNIIYPADSLRVITGSSSIGRYESSPGKFRHFCVGCGSPLYSRSTVQAAFVSIRSGLLKDDPGVRPQCHLYVASRAWWTVINDGLPQHPAGLGG
jgi:hypothetical protein